MTRLPLLKTCTFCFFRQSAGTLLPPLCDATDAPATQAAAAHNRPNRIFVERMFQTSECWRDRIYPRRHTKRHETKTRETARKAHERPCAFLVSFRVVSWIKFFPSRTS